MYRFLFLRGRPFSIENLFIVHSKLLPREGDEGSPADDLIHPIPSNSTQLHPIPSNFIPSPLAHAGAARGGDEGSPADVLIPSNSTQLHPIASNSIPSPPTHAGAARGGDEGGPADVSGEPRGGGGGLAEGGWGPGHPPSLPPEGPAGEQQSIVNTLM